MKNFLRFCLWAVRGAAVAIGIILIFAFLTIAQAAPPPPILTISAVIDKKWVDQVGPQEVFEWTHDALVVAAMIYKQQTGVQLKVVDMDVKPLANTRHPLVLLNKIMRVRSGSTVKRDTGITIFFTNRKLEIGPQEYLGWSSAESLCSRYSAAVVRLKLDPDIDPYVITHEIAHSFGVPHDGIEECASEPTTGYIMEATLGPESKFSQCSLQIIKKTVAANPCLTRTPQPVQSPHKGFGRLDGTALLVLSIFTLYAWITRRLK
jgi:hypothetical protein